MGAPEDLADAFGGDGRIGVLGKPRQVPGVRCPQRLPSRCREILERRVSITPLPSPVGNSSGLHFQGRLQPGREGSRSRHCPVAAMDTARRPWTPVPTPLRPPPRIGRTQDGEVEDALCALAVTVIAVCVEIVSALIGRIWQEQAPGLPRLGFVFSPGDHR